MFKHDWSRDEILKIYNQSFPNLIFQAQSTHRQYFDPTRIQRSTLLSIKTGACPEDCKYCPQSAHYETEVEKHSLLDVAEVMAKAKEAQAEGSTRFCMGAAWREVREGKDFDSVLELVRGVSELGLEVCCTLGMLSYEQAVKLKEAGCYAYNHNLDTAPEYYGRIITTRTYEDRLRTLANVRRAGITVCCGGIIGLGESLEHRIGLLQELSNQNPHPESVPINMLIRIKGTPLENVEEVKPRDFVRTIACARMLMPRSMVRLSAGRTDMSDEMQALCFLAGANSIFAGERLLTAPNPGEDHDIAMMTELGLEFSAELEPKFAANC